MKKAALMALLLGLIAEQAFAVYVILLRNGGRVVAREKYEVKGVNAIFTDKIGTLKSIPLAQIDVEATAKINTLGLGDAQSLDWVDREQVKPTPTSTPSVTGLGRVRAGVVKVNPDSVRPTPTPGIMYREKEYPDRLVTAAFASGFEAYHIYLYRMSLGTQPTYLFIEVQVNGQPETLKALQAVTTTYYLLFQKLPVRAPERVEIQMLNESGREAGLFRISAEEAADLATGKITAENYFVQHVIF